MVFSSATASFSISSRFIDTIPSTTADNSLPNDSERGFSRTFWTDDLEFL